MLEWRYIPSQVSMAGDACKVGAYVANVGCSCWSISDENDAAAFKASSPHPNSLTSDVFRARGAEGVTGFDVVVVVVVVVAFVVMPDVFE